MKHLLILVFITASIIACKQEVKSEIDAPSETDTTTQTVVEAPKRLLSLNGEFLFDGKNAVMQMGNNMFAVEMSDKTKELIKQCEQFKENKYDFVRVAVNGYLVDNPEEGWEKQVLVKTILRVQKSTADKNITIKSSK